MTAVGRITHRPRRVRRTPLHPGPAHPRERRTRPSGRRSARDEILEDYPYLEPDDITAVLGVFGASERRSGQLPAIVRALEQGETLVEVA